MAFYEVTADPYCYPGSSVLINKLDIRDQAALTAFEAEITRQRGAEPLPVLPIGVRFYRSIHHHLFQDVYPWAGKLRTVRMTRGESPFAYPEHLRDGLHRLFVDLRRARLLRGLASEVFAGRAAHVLAELNALHPFRDGNGRTQFTFVAALADQAGHVLHLDRLEPARFLDAMIASFYGDEAALAAELRGLID